MYFQLLLRRANLLLDFSWNLFKNILDDLLPQLCNLFLVCLPQFYELLSLCGKMPLLLVCLGTYGSQVLLLLVGSVAYFCQMCMLLINLASQIDQVLVCSTELLHYMCQISQVDFASSTSKTSTLDPGLSSLDS